MKVKELLKTVNVAWSPAEQTSIYLAAGTAAQQLDTNFHSNAAIELYAVNLADPGYDMELKASQPSQHKFHKLIWSPFGASASNSGSLIGGCEGGHIQIYNPTKLLAQQDALVADLDKHTGTVRALDFNPFQSNLMASAASESEIFIWDLNNTTTPMMPGAKIQPYEDVQAVAWNRQVQHILASVLSSRCVIWDLRKNEPIIKLSDTQSRVRWRVMQWHPENATQLWLASEEDHSPMVQLWDLRYATSPTKSLAIHQRGILGLTWCPQDHDLMVSCGKDNKILCWNPNSNEPNGEVLSEIASTVQWYSDVQWCPRNPALIASSSLDGNVTIYSVLGGSQQQVQTTNKIADSFPGMDQMSQMQQPVPQQATHVVYSDLKKPPKWLARPAGAKFGFGGKLVSFGSDSGQVKIAQVITEPELVANSQKLEAVLQGGQFSEYCREKADQMDDQAGRYLWYFLKANFEPDARAEFLNLLGFHREDIRTKMQKYVKGDAEVDKLAAGMQAMGNGGEGTLPVDNNAMFEAIAADQKHVKENGMPVPFPINVDEYGVGLISQALLTGNIEAAVELCMAEGRTTEAIIIAITGDSSLLSRTQLRYFEENSGKNPLLHLISALVTRDCTSIAEQCQLDSWKQALVAILTHSQTQDQVQQQATILGDRLLKEATLASAQNALLCFICAANLDRIVEAWELAKKLAPDAGQKRQDAKQTIADQQELIEIVMIMQKSMEAKGSHCGAAKVMLPQKVESLLVNYGMMLANQGAFESALKYVQGTDNEKVVELSQRLFYSLGLGQPQPVKPAATAQHPYHHQQPQQHRPVQPAFATVASPPTVPVPGHPGQVNSFNNYPAFGNTPASMFNPMATASPMVPAALPPMASTLPPMAPVVDQPPRPPSSGSASGAAASGGGGLAARSKYPRDPSVQSGPAYGQTNYFNPAFNGAGAGMMPQQPAAATPMAPQMFNPGNTFNPAPMGGAMGYGDSAAVPQPGAASMGGNSQPVMGRNPTPPPGWNDPPAVSSSRVKPPQAPPAVPAADPITHPLFGVDPNPQMPQQQQQQQQHPGMMGMMQPQAGYGQNPSVYNPAMGQQMGGQFMPAMTPQQPMGTVPPPHGQFGQATTMAAPPAAAAVYPAREPTPVLQKAPIPEEYAYLQTVFNELRLQCSNTSMNPQMKRKLDDVAKRLESLYDLLRENRLTANTLQSLNQLVQYVQNGDYQSGLMLHTQMCSGPDFAQLASFMPGIKVLLQSAMQLQVYLR